MKQLTLIRQNHNSPEFGKLYKMLDDLKGFLHEEIMPAEGLWFDNLQEVLDFQAEDGSFSLLDSFRTEADARVDFCYMPTYMCSAILMKAFMEDEELLGDEGRDLLRRALAACCGRSLRGHGYEDLAGQIEAINIFIEAGVREFVNIYPDICPEFTEMIKKVKQFFCELRNTGRFTDAWGVDFEEKIRDISHYLSSCNVFVYGTLMSGERNHNYYLSKATFLGRAVVEGFDMYDLGAFPGIVEGVGIVKGELYEVSNKELVELDHLEDEGNLYIKRCVTVTTEYGNKYRAYIYAFNQSIGDAEIISEWK